MLQKGEEGGDNGDGESQFQGSENLTDTAPKRKGSKYMTGINSEPFLKLKIKNKYINK